LQNPNFDIHPLPTLPPSRGRERVGGIEGQLINQTLVLKTPKTKSLLSSLYKREEFPSLKKRG
jgi:hypothetical protein